MTRSIVLLVLVAGAGAMLVSGRGGVLSGRVATRAKEDLVGAPARGVGVVLLAASAAVIWMVAALEGARGTGMRSPSDVAAVAFTGTTVTAVLAWGLTGVIQRRIHLRMGPIVGRKATGWSLLVIAAAPFEIGLLLFLATP